MRAGTVPLRCRGRGAYVTRMSPSPTPVSAWQVALLRGVNVGPGKRVPMAELVAIVEACGYTRVRTLLNSGNVVYVAPRVAPATAARRIEAGLADRLDVETPVFVRTGEQLAQLLAENPMPREAASHPSAFLVKVWADDAADAVRASLEAAPFTIERVIVGAHAAYLSLPAGISASKPLEVVLRQLGPRVTTRNWNTMTTLRRLMESV